MTNTKLFISLFLFLCTSMVTSLIGQDSSMEREVFKVVEEMPMFPGCENEDISLNEKLYCAKNKMIEFIANNLKYPKAARENGTEGMCVAQFVVNKDGTLSDIKLIRDIGDGCGQASVNAIQKMNEMKMNWIPGKQRGQVVDVLMTVPVKFSIPKD